MDTFAPWRFVFDIVYVVFMEMLFQNIVGGIMIDAFSELKEEDETRDEDKCTLCYICGMDKPTVLFFLFRWKEADLLSISTSKNTPYGTIFIIFTV
jgi:hypothetical protein